MSISRPSFGAAIAAVAFLILAASGGCAALRPTGASGDMPIEGGEQAGDSAAAQPAGMVSVELRGEGRTPEIKKLPLESGMRVQQVLEQSGAVKRFRRMHVDVMRLTGDHRAKLEVQYDHGHRSVHPLYDYALHPGDHIVVEEDTSNIVDDMLNSLLTPLGLNQQR